MREEGVGPTEACRRLGLDQKRGKALMMAIKRFCERQPPRTG